YLGTVGDGDSYKLAKYTDTSGTTRTSNVAESKVGLLRLGELMAGQFNRVGHNTYYYWTVIQYNTHLVSPVNNYTYDIASNYGPSSVCHVRPSIKLKSNVQIVSGDGTKNNPFQIALS